MAKRDRFQPRTVRQFENPVTHEIERVALDAVQNDFDLCCDFIESRMTRHSNGDAARLGAKLAEWLRHWEGKK